ncbi:MULTISPECIES: hypothetical protein [unclassified Streptomyces]|uniref:hypothetical protein n=1 Tax=unclassified Streptomyces TaxID=2593676 RepID=UPI002E8011E5|nr:hypothetical protein [Streptomyces sp. NBC_00589]WTI33643.1 hypothetical protein OIC96_00740 [Streptomyces sp. NBC_00775]WUB32685.1 hypothetical protein OHA51_48995 [Streptomyces sp. NBC_00589]
MALSDIAGVVAAVDGGEALRIAADAERIAQTRTNRGLTALAGIDSKGQVLVIVAGAMAALDAAKALRTAQSITDTGSRAMALAAVAEVVAAVDGGEALRIAADAERVAQTISSNDQTFDGVWKQMTLGALVVAVRAVDANEALRIAQTMTDKGLKVAALAGVARLGRFTSALTGADVTGPARLIVQDGLNVGEGR